MWNLDDLEDCRITLCISLNLSIFLLYSQSAAFSTDKESTPEEAFWWGTMCRCGWYCWGVSALSTCKQRRSVHREFALQALLGFGEVWQKTQLLPCKRPLPWRTFLCREGARNSCYVNPGCCCRASAWREPLNLWRQWNQWNWKWE